MEKKETYKAPEMRSVVLIKEGVMQQTSNFADKNAAGLMGEEENDRTYSF